MSEMLTTSRSIFFEKKKPSTFDLAADNNNPTLLWKSQPSRMWQAVLIIRLLLNTKVRKNEKRRRVRRSSFR